MKNREPGIDLLLSYFLCLTLPIYIFSLLLGKLVHFGSVKVMGLIFPKKKTAPVSTPEQCCSDHVIATPVTDVTGVAISSVRGIPTPVCPLARNDIAHRKGKLNNKKKSGGLRLFAR